MGRYYFKIILALVFLQQFPVLSHSQQRQYITVDQAVQFAVSENRSVQIATKDELLAAARYKQTDAIFLPQAQFSYTALSTNNPLNAFGFKLQQKQIGSADFDPRQLNDPGATPDLMTKLDIQQPILNLEMNYKRKAAAKQMVIYGFATQRTKEAVAFEVQKTYLQLQLAYEAKKVLQSAFKTAKAFGKLSEDYYDQGLTQKSDLLYAKLQVTGIETRISELDNNISNISDYLGLLMNKQSGVIYLPDSLSLKMGLADSATVSENRADLRAIRATMDVYDLMITASKKSYSPKLNAFASYQYNNTSLFRYNANAYLAGIQLSWDIFKGNATRNKIAEQQLEVKKLQDQFAMQKEQSDLQLVQAKRELVNSGYKITQFRQAAAQAEEAFRITQNRFQQGLVRSADVLAAQTQLMEKQMALAEAVFQYDLSLYQVQFLTTAK